MDALKETGQLAGLLESLARFSDHAAVLNALKANQIAPTRTIRLGPPLVFQRLWEQLDLPGILQRLLAGRKAIVEKLRGQLKQGSKSLVGNKGYRKFLSARSGGAYHVDEAKVKQDARFDGKWVLQTDADLPAEEVALRYKDLLLVEDAFRTMKSILETRPIYHKSDDTIRGHVFCSFLALVLQQELQSRLESRGWITEWQRLRDDLDELQELTLPLGEKTFVIRTPPVGDASRALRAAGVGLGPSVRLL